METSRYSYNGKLWKPCRTTSDNNSFFHSAFGSRTEESGAYFDKQAQFRRLRWASFVAYFENENIPLCLVDILRKCVSANDKSPIDDKQNLTQYLSHIMASEQMVRKEDIPILATLETTKVVILSERKSDPIVVNPNPNILGTYSIITENLKEVVLSLRGNIFSKLEAVSEDLISISNSDETESKGLPKSHTSRYKKGGSAGSKGVQYQVSLLAVVLLNSFKNLKEWKLSTENDDAGKFDDVVLECPEGATFIQSKHKESNKKRITLDELISCNSKNDDFSLPKYFLSYLLIKNKFIVKNVILCTNADVHEKALKFLDRQEAYPESVLHDNSGDYIFYTLKDEALQVLEGNIKNYYKQNFRNKGIEESAINEENLKNFQQHLQIYFKYFSQKSMDKIVDKLLSSIKCCNNSLNKLFNSDVSPKLLDWFQQKDGIHLTELYAKGTFAGIWRDKYCQKLEHYNVSFNRNDLNFENTKQIFHITASLGHLLYTIKIYHALRYDKTKILFINFDDDKDIQKLIVDSFELPQYVFLIIICPKVTVKLLTEETYAKLKYILMQYESKKIILIGNCNNLLQLTDFCCDIAYLEISATFEDLSSTSQEWLIRKKNVIFQGQRITVEELLNLEIPTDYGKFLNADIIEMLLRGQDIKVGTSPSDLDENTRPYYLNRTFTRKLVTMQEEDATIKSSEKTDRQQRRIWSDDKIEEVFSENEIYNVKEKFVLIADAAGMGKSTALVKLALIVKAQYPHLWVIKIAVSNFTKILRDSLRESRKTITIEELLNSENGTKLTNHLEKAVLFYNRNIVLMLDGVDEVSPDYTEPILNILKQCKKESNIVKVFITIRPHMIKDLIAVLNVKPFVLQPLTLQNQVDFLSRYWAHNLKVKDDKSKDKCKRYAQKLLKDLSLTNLGDEIEKLTAVPLHVRMIAEIFQDNSKTIWSGCREYLMNNEAETKSKEKMNVTRLYDLFIEKKRDIFIDVNNPTGNTAANQALMEQFNENLVYHQSLAIEVILSEDKVRYFSTYRRNNRIMEANMVKIGVVQKLNDKFHFAHRTFADYFVAKCLLTELQQNKSSEFQTFFIETILLRPEYNNTRVFIDGILQKVGDSLPPSIFINYQSDEKESSRKFSITQSAKLTHLLAGEGNKAILQLIFKCIYFRIVQDKRINITDFYQTNLNKDNQKTVFNNTLNILQCLTEEAGINITDEDGSTPLHSAAQRGRLDMIKFLIERGATSNVTNNFGHTVLHLASMNGQLETVNYLIEYGIDCNITDNNGYKALHVAAQYGQLDIVMLFVKHGLDCNVKCIGRGTTPLHLASANGHMEIVKYLLELGVDPNTQQHNGFTILHSATLYGKLESVKYLLDHGADPSIQDNNGYKVLHISAQYGKLDIFKLFLKYGLDCNDKSSGRGTTPLHLASANGRMEIVKHLLQLGVDPNIQQNNGFAVLHSAALYGKLESVRYLLEHGADASIRDNNGYRPLHVAAQYGKLDIFKLFLKYGLDCNDKSRGRGTSPLHLASANGRMEIVKYLLELGVDPNTQQNNGYTVLHSATIYGQLESIKYLLAHGADSNIEDNNKCSALHIAVQRGKLDIMKLFLENGLDCNDKNSRITTLLQLADANGHTEIVTYLLELGVDCSVTK